MLPNLLLIALLSAAPDVGALRRELDAVAGRIEELKARRQAGQPVEAELEPLLVRSQELVEAIERARPPAAATSPAVSDPGRALADELRAHAADLRDEADRLAGEVDEVDARVAEARWGGSAPPLSSLADPLLTPASIVRQGTSAVDDDELARLFERRADLVARIHGLHVRASNLDAAADALERTVRRR